MIIGTCATIALGWGSISPMCGGSCITTCPRTRKLLSRNWTRRRDGLPSDTLLFYSYGDIIQHRYFIGESNQQDLLEASQRIRYAMRRSVDVGLLSYFEEEVHKTATAMCKNPQNALMLLSSPRKLFGLISPQRVVEQHAHRCAPRIHQKRTKGEKLPPDQDLWGWSNMSAGITHCTPTASDGLPSYVPRGAYLKRPMLLAPSYLR